MAYVAILGFVTVYAIAVSIVLFYTLNREATATTPPRPNAATQLTRK